MGSQGDRPEWDKSGVHLNPLRIRRTRGEEATGKAERAGGETRGEAVAAGRETTVEVVGGETTGEVVGGETTGEVAAEGG